MANVISSGKDVAEDDRPQNRNTATVEPAADKAITLLALIRSHSIDMTITPGTPATFSTEMMAELSSTLKPVARA